MRAKMRFLSIVVSVLLISSTLVMFAGAAAASPDGVTLTVLSINDSEGYLEGSGWPLYLGGAAYVSGYFNQVRSENPNTLLLHAGDIWSPGPLISMLFDGASFVDWMNLAGFDMACIGNHEYDLGQDVLADRMAQAEFPMLAANVYYDNGDPVYESSIVVEVSGIKVGIIGLALPTTLEITVPAFTEGLNFTDGIAEVNELVPELEDLGATVIIVVGHYGDAEAVRPLAEGIDPEHVDLIISGHAGPIMEEINGIPAIACRGKMVEVGRVDFVVDETGEVISYTWEKVEIDPKVTPADPAAEELVAYYAAKVEEVKLEVIGYTTDPIVRIYWEESPMGDLFTDAERWLCEREGIPCDFAFQNPGGLRADIDAGEITFGEVFEVLPFPNYLVICEATGEQVRAALEDGMGPKGCMQVSGLRFLVDWSRPRGERIIGPVIDLRTGKPLIPDEVYYIAVNNFMAAGGDKYATLATLPQVEYSYIKYVDPMVEWIRANSPFTPPDPAIELRVIPLPLPATIDIDPDTLDLKSRGRWITCYIELLLGYDVANIDVSTVALEGILSAEPWPTEIGDHDGDGVPDLMVKFDRVAVRELVSIGDNVELTIIGKWGPAPFRGSDTVRVIGK